MQTGSINFAFDCIRRNNATACKYAPRGPQADAVQAWVGRPGCFEVFISERQAEVLRGMQDDYGIVKAGTPDGDWFAGFVKSIYSEKKGKEYFLFVFSGFIPEVVVSAPTTTAVNSDRANQFAATLIASAIEKGRATKDERAAEGDDYLCTWLSRGQADALVAQLPGEAIKPDGNILTQACGSYAYWSKVRMQTGSMMLCWMGDVSGPVATVAVPVAKPTAIKPVAVSPAGKRIPMDADIPF